MPQKDQTLFVHCGPEWLDYQNVAERLGISQDAVAKRGQRLRARLTEQGVPERLFPG